MRLFFTHTPVAYLYMEPEENICCNLTFNALHILLCALTYEEGNYRGLGEI